MKSGNSFNMSTPRHKGSFAFTSSSISETWTTETTYPAQSVTRFPDRSGCASTWFMWPFKLGRCEAQTAYGSLNLSWTTACCGKGTLTTFTPGAYQSLFKGEKVEQYKYHDSSFPEERQGARNDGVSVETEENYPTAPIDGQGQPMQGTPYRRNSAQRCQPRWSLHQHVIPW